MWELKWASHSERESGRGTLLETNMHCTRSSGICLPNPNSLALIDSEISAFIRTDGHG